MDGTIEEETEKEYKTIKALVYYLLQTNERCRNDDKYLVYCVYQQIARQNGKKIFIPFDLFLKFPAFETISRCRRYIQNKQEELLPTNPEVIMKRSARQKKIKEMMVGDFRV